MKIGIYDPEHCARSVRIYIDHVTRGLVERGVKVRRLSATDTSCEDADVYWDPAATAGRPPHPIFQRKLEPVVVTVHGAAPFAVPAFEYYSDLGSVIRGSIRKARKILGWWLERRSSISIITVSRVAEEEIRKHLPVRNRKIIPIYHGVDTAVFFARDPKPEGRDRSFFLHASFYQPKKNIENIIEAYQRAGLANTVGLKMVVPGLPPEKARSCSGVEWILQPLSHDRLADLMRDARGFVFPSLRESFGLPIVEAMACGCPVITSNDSACREVAGEAALLVSPRSVEEISQAFSRLARRPGLRGELRDKGIARAREFSWERSVEAHLRVFRTARRSAADHRLGGESEPG